MSNYSISICMPRKNKYKSLYLHVNFINSKKHWCDISWLRDMSWFFSSSKSYDARKLAENNATLTSINGELKT